MRKLLLAITFILSALPGLASHIVGGEMIYEYIGAGTIQGTKKYRIILRLFRDEECPPPCAEMPDNVYIGIFRNSDRSQFPSAGSHFDIKKNTEGRAPVGSPPPCVVNPPSLNYHIAEYRFEVDLPDTPEGYTAAYQTCCRVNPLSNVYNTPASPGNGTGSTYSCIIPGTNQLGASGHNNSPQFTMKVSPICKGKPFELDFSAQDKDPGDSLVYYLCEAYDGGRASSSQNINPAPPPYGDVPYINGYQSTNPLGNGVSINRNTGIITGTAPGIGEYVVCVCIDEYRNGNRISTHRKDFIVNVTDCDFAGAQLDPSYTFCESLTASFQNKNNSPLNETYYWDFGDGSTSTEKTPTHTYADTGTYAVKLVINRGQPCGDSTTAIIRVYPFFKADFSVAGLCVNKRTSFRDRTTATYGTVTAWNWDFGDGINEEDVSTERNPAYTYTQTGTKNVVLIATSSKGCKDTVLKEVVVFDKPPLSVRFKDTLICNGDRLQLEAIGDGAFSWAPSNNMAAANTATPTVSPSATATYFVTLDADGCINHDSVQVRVVNFVTLQARSDTTICATDNVQLSAVSDGLRFEWSPAETLDDATRINPVALPNATTTYRVTAYIGGCAPVADDVTVTLVPYPVANAGPDTVICYETGAQLSGNIVGKTFSWSPDATLANANTLRPLARPSATTEYLLTVYDNIGCPKPGMDGVVVTVLPEVQAFAGRDTIVVMGQPLQLAASGGVSYTWQPSASLSNPAIANPVGIYDGSFETIRYKVLVADEAGCTDSAFVSVRIFKTDPRIFVPSAFTPNRDDRNEVFRPIAAGMSRIEYFKVFNRWGQLVFSSTTDGSGWDGRVNGRDQSSGTYVWVVKGVDYTGKEFFAKGTVTLIR